MIRREVVIGDCRLLASSALRLHVAGLTKSNQITAGIRCFGGIEKPERQLVVDGERAPDVLPAFGAVPALIRNDLGTSDKPAPATIGCGATDVADRLVGNKATGRLEALPAAKARDSVLASNPRLLPEVFPAKLALEGDAFLPVRIGLASNSLRRERVSGPLSDPEFVSDHVRLGADIKRLRCAPRPTALVRAEPSKALRTSAIRLHVEATSTDFAIKFNCHINKIGHSQRMSTGAGTAEVAPAQGALF